LKALDEEGLLKWDETFWDGSFASAKKGSAALGKTKRSKGTQWMVLVDGECLPLGVRLESASPSEVKLAEAMGEFYPWKAEWTVTCGRQSSLYMYPNTARGWVEYFIHYAWKQPFKKSKSLVHAARWLRSFRSGE
jgi:hypothetical protein